MTRSRGILALFATSLLGVTVHATPASASICEAALVYRTKGSVASCSAYASNLLFVGATGVTDIHIYCNGGDAHVVEGTFAFTATPSAPCVITVVLTALVDGTTSYAMTY